jgi:ethanolamine utilization protein EutN
LFTAKVVGNIWATRKVPSLENKRLMLVRPYDPMEDKCSGATQMAVCDSIDAGIGDIVLVMDEGSSARQILKDDNAPIRTIIVGVIDLVTARGKTVKCQ